MINPLPFIYADIRKMRVGVIAVILLIAVAVAIGIAVLTQERAFQRGSSYAVKPFGLIVGASQNHVQLVLSTIYLHNAAVDTVDGKVMSDLQSMDGIEMITPIVSGGSYQKHRLVGAAPDFIMQSRENPLMNGRVFQSINEAVIGCDVKLDIGDEFHPSFKPSSEKTNRFRNKMGYTVVGRLQKWYSPWDQAIIVPVEGIWLLNNLPTGHKNNEVKIQKFGSPFLPAAKVNNASLADRGIQKKDGSESFDFKMLKIGPPWDEEYIPDIPVIVVNFSNLKGSYLMRSEFKKREKLTAFFPHEVLNELHSLMGNVNGMLTTVAFAIQVLVVLAILLAIWASLSNKESQFGILRALGAERSFIFSLIWIHLTLIIIVGAFLGLGFGWCIAKMLSSHIHGKTGLSLPTVLSITELRMFFSLIFIGSALSIIPSIGIYRKNVSELLRSGIPS